MILFKYFNNQSLPTSNKAELPDAACYDYLRTEDGIVRGGFVEVGVCEAVDEVESDCDLENDDDSLPILMNSTYLTTALVHGTTLLPVCVSALFKQALIFTITLLAKAIPSLMFVILALKLNYYQTTSCKINPFFILGVAVFGILQ